MSMKSTARFVPGRLTRSHLIDLTDRLKRRSATEIFKRIGVKRYSLRGATYVVPGLLAAQGLPKKAPLRVINDDHYYRAEELLEFWKEYATDAELEKLTR